MHPYRKFKNYSGEDIDILNERKKPTYKRSKYSEDIEEDEQEETGYERK